MSSYGSDDFNFSALEDYSPWTPLTRTSTPIPSAAGVGTSLNTPPSPLSSLATPPLPNVSPVGVGTAGAGAPQTNVTVGVGSAGSVSRANVTTGVGAPRITIRHTFGTSCSRRETTETRPTSKYTDVLQ